MVGLRLPGPRLAWACALTGVLLLAGASAWMTPPRPALSELAAHEGARVTVAGRIVHAAPHGDGTRITLTDGAYRVDAWVRGATGAARGDEVEVTGRVGVKAGRYSLSLDARDLRVTQQATETVLRPAELAEDPARYAATLVRVEGLLLREGGAWWLRDAWTNRAVRLDGIAGVEEGGPGEAWGLFRYAPQRAGYVLEVEAWTPQALPE